MRKFFQEFGKFIQRGNVMDMAVGVIIGAAFKAIVDSVVNDILMPVLSLVTGGLDFSNLFLSLNGQHYDSLAEAKAAGAATLNYGSLITAVINFFILALIIFCMVKALNKFAELRDRLEHKEKEAPTTKTCPFCKSKIDIKATRCPHCTSELPEETPEETPEAPPEPEKEEPEKE